MATNYDALISRDFHAKAFERANGSPSGRQRVNVREGSPSSNMRCRNDAKGRIEPGKDAERIAFDRKEKRERNKRNANAKNVDGLIAPRIIGVVLYRDGVKVEQHKRTKSPRLFHQTDVKTNHYRFNAGGIVDVYATNKREAYAKFKDATGLDRVPARALMFINGKAVQ